MNHDSADQKAPLQPGRRHRRAPAADDRGQHHQPERLQQHALCLGERLVPAGHEQLLDSRGDQSGPGHQGLPEPVRRRAHRLRQNSQLSGVSGLHPDRQSAQHRRVHHRQRGEPVPVHPGVSGVRAQPELQLHAGQHLQPGGAQRHPLSVEDRRAPAAPEYLHRRSVQRVPAAQGPLYPAESDDGQLHSGGHLLLQRLHVLLQPGPQRQDARLGPGDPLHQPGREHPPVAVSEHPSGIAEGGAGAVLPRECAGFKGNAGGGRAAGDRLGSLRDRRCHSRPDQADGHRLHTLSGQPALDRTRLRASV